ncbi:MAG: DNA replication/repair protein RecF [Clostridia bacterium]
MEINNLYVNNFRNLASQTLELSQGLNIFYGDNAQGKTNLLESAYLCCLGKSVRTERDKDLIRIGCDSCYVKLGYASISGTRDISIAISKDKKVASINTLPLARIGELLGYLNCIYFSPDEISVITLSPSQRRRFLDIDLCQLNKQYYHALVRFNRILVQRNNLLKKSNNITTLKDSLSIWDAQLAKEGGLLTYQRKLFCTRLAEIVLDTHKFLTQKEKLNMTYIPSVDGDTVEEITANYLAKLTASVEKDFAQRFTTTGCQRDDIKFCVDDADIRVFGSQGQQRTTALSLKLAELQLFYDITKDYPILLLDDVLSELDRTRQKALLSYNDKVQIILTGTKVDKMLTKHINSSRFVIKNGLATKLD